MVGRATIRIVAFVSVAFCASPCIELPQATIQFALFACAPALSDKLRPAKAIARVILIRERRELFIVIASRVCARP